MTVKELLKELESLGDAKVKALNTKNGVSDKQYGVKLGDLRVVAKKIKLNHALALELWETGHFDARMLSMLIIEPKKLSADELDRLVRSADHARIADWLNSYVVKVHPENEKLRQRWMKDKDPMALRAGWNLTAQRVRSQRELIDAPALLTRIEKEMGKAHPDAQWTMNFVLAEIGVNFPELRERAIAIGEKLGVYRDWPAPKGCTSPFAPIWINEMVKRQGL